MKYPKWGSAIEVSGAKVVYSSLLVQCSLDLRFPCTCPPYHRLESNLRDRLFFIFKPGSMVLLQHDLCQSNRPELSPEALCHIVLRTTPANYEPMIEFYLTMVGGRISHKTYRLCFIGYDHEHHRLAIISDLNAVSKNISPETKRVVGLHHVAFGFPKLADLATSYKEKKAAGVMPDWCVNHGMTISMYYNDPDGNQVEFQVDTLPSAREAVEYMNSSEFEENPVGVDFDPEVFCQRLKNGEDEASIKIRPNIGKRDRR